ncbi:MAG TPA: ion channel [Myxococcales bacterium]|nr:ion channel [Myxococcales bacterium]
MKKAPAKIVPEARLFADDPVGTLVVGVPRRASDFYHSLLRASWKRTFLLIAGTFLLVNVVFALAYSASGGVAGARPGSILDAFFFSVQTLSTVGYGELRPVTPLANWLVVAELICGIVTLAGATGLVIAKFTRPTSRILFSKVAAIAAIDGVPTLTFRVANARRNLIVSAEVNVVLIRTEHTKEGQLLYRMHDLPLVRGRVPIMTRTYLVQHRITPGSLLDGATPQTLARDEVQLAVTVTGLDGTTSQTIYAGTDYLDTEIRFGVRFADMMSEMPDGRLRIDYSRFDDLVASP